MIEIRIDQLLKAHGRTFYWLAKETALGTTGTFYESNHPNNRRRDFNAHVGEWPICLTNVASRIYGRAARDLRATDHSLPVRNE